jgi:hypothetical protein
VIKNGLSSLSLVNDFPLLSAAADERENALGGGGWHFLPLAKAPFLPLPSILSQWQVLPSAAHRREAEAEEEMDGKGEGKGQQNANAKSAVSAAPK